MNTDKLLARSTPFDPFEHIDFSALDTQNPLDPGLHTLVGLVDLTPEQSRRLAKEEFCSGLESGLRIEALFMSAIGLMLARDQDVTSLEAEYKLIELTEECNHSRVFQALLRELKPQTKMEIYSGLHGKVLGAFLLASFGRPRLWWIITQAGEEIPDMFSRFTVKNPLTDPVIREALAYHRREEARHLAFARAEFQRVWRGAGLYDRLYVRFVMPTLIRVFAASYVHPNVYKSVGLPPYRTWLRGAKNAHSNLIHAMASRKVLRSLQEAGLYKRRVPRGWQRLCQL